MAAEAGGRSMRKMLSSGLWCACLVGLCGAGAAQQTFSVTITGNASEGYSAVAAAQVTNCYPDDGDGATTSISLEALTDREGGYSASIGIPTTYVGPGSYVASGNFSGYNGYDSSGNPCFAYSATDNATLTIPGGVGSATQFSDGPPPISVVVGMPLILTVSAAPGINYQYFTPLTGSVTLLEGKRVLATSPVSSGSASFSLPTTGISPGTYQITAAYSGDSNYFPSTSTASSVTVEPVQQPTTLALAVTPNPLVAGDKVQLQATVTPTQGGFAPTGTVTFSAEGRVLGTASVVGGTMATLSLSSAGIAPGTYRVIAKYSGDANNKPSTSPTISVSVLAQSETTTSLAITPSPTLVQGDTLTFAATVAQVTGDTTPAGNVNFLVDGKTISSLALSDGATSLNLSTSGLAAGTYVVSAAYTGNKMDQPSTSAAQSVILLATTATRLSATPNPVTRGGIVFLSATVNQTQGNAIPTGTVTFSYEGISLGTATLASGSASLPLDTGGLPAGSYALIATYSGDAANNTSTSNALTVIVQ